MPIYTNDGGWVLATKSTGYALGLTRAGRLVHRYWGTRLPAPGDYPPAAEPPGWPFNGPEHLALEEYPVHGQAKYSEPCLSATFADGVRDLRLRFESAERRDGDAPELHLHLHDEHEPLRLTLSYRVHETYDLIERWATLTNDGEAPITLERAWSAQWHMPPGEGYRLTHLNGRWFEETQVRREMLARGVKMLESRRLISGHHHNPWFAVDSGAADEDNGEVWFGVLAWSGNWQIAAEVTDFLSTRVSAGLGEWDFAWRLRPGESFHTPPIYAGYTADGFGGASRLLHDFARATLPHPDEPRKVIYNSWYATTFNVDEESQTRLAEIAAAMGVELFVMDDGWFQRRNDDHAGLGDWWPDPVKFPRGLQPLIDRVNALGMDFGLWIEPEMVNPDSDLYRAHPDWVIHFPGRPRTEMRNQLILNLARPDVQDYLIDAFDRLLATHSIAFVKWDMNRAVSEPGWPGAEEPREIWVRYVQGLYRVWGTLRERHQRVIWESCAGGGGRADLGILRYADQVWVSDNTEATARLAIQEGFSYAYPASTMVSWVIDDPQRLTPLPFRFHVAMTGVLGVGGNLLAWTEAERDEARGLVARYKEIRSLVQHGDLYRLRSPGSGGLTVVQYVSKDRSDAVLFLFRIYLPEPVLAPPVLLRGLDPAARYQVEGLPGARSGASLMHAGLRFAYGYPPDGSELGIPMPGNFGSAVLRIRRVE